MRQKVNIVGIFLFVVVSFNRGFGETTETSFYVDKTSINEKESLENNTRKISFVERLEGEIIENLSEEDFKFKVGEVIIFSAEANPGFFFSHWEVNGDKVSESLEFEYKMPDKDIKVVGHFKKLLEPVIQIVSPGNNTIYESNVSVPVRFEAKSDNGRISKIELFRNGEFLVSINDPNIVFNLNISQVGSSILTAKATDERGAVAFSPEVRIEIIQANIAPVVKIISPGNGEEFPEGTDIKIEAEAIDSDGEIVKVDFFSNGNLIGFSTAQPFTFVLPKPLVGTYSITAKAFDDKGKFAESQPINLVVRPILKISEVEILTPVPQQVFEADESVLFSVVFNNGDENVKRVEYYSGSQILGVSDSRPFSFEWKNVLPGDYDVKAVAIGGYPEMKKESASVKIQVKNIPFEIVTPSRNARLTAGTDLQIRVQIPFSSKKVKSVEYFRGNQLVGFSTSTPYSFTWKNIPIGEHNLVARLIYEDNSTQLSNVVKVFSENKTKPKINLSYKVVNPENSDENAEVSFIVDIQDLTSPNKEVEYYINGNLIGSNTVDPFGFIWRDVKPGKYSIVARLTDINGMQINTKESIFEILDLFKKEIEENKLIDYVIGPNPTSEWLNIFFKDVEYFEDLRIYVVSINGTIVRIFNSTIQESKVTLDLLDLRPGVYVLQMELGKSYIPSIRFIKK